MTTELVYSTVEPPAVGSGVELCRGVHWLRLPVPGRLQHINVWLLDDGDCWTLIDTGMDVPDSRAFWETSLSTYLGTRPLTRIICTHHHPDHAGLAGFLARRFCACVYMSAPEYRLIKTLESFQHDSDAKIARRNAFARDGLVADGELVDVMMLTRYAQVVSPVPDNVSMISDGDVIMIGGNSWRAMLVRGHTDGQLVFHCPQLNLLIAGDQVLPKISSNIGIYPERVDQDPVGSFVASFKPLVALDPEPLVLPSHGSVFSGLRARLATLTAHHLVTLDRCCDLLDVPCTALEVAGRLFRGPLDALNTILALGETLANLEHLLLLGRVHVALDAFGVRRWVRLGAGDTRG